MLAVIKMEKQAAARRCLRRHMVMIINPRTAETQTNRPKNRRKRGAGRSSTLSLKLPRQTPPLRSRHLSSLSPSHEYEPHYPFFVSALQAGAKAAHLLPGSEVTAIMRRRPSSRTGWKLLAAPLISITSHKSTKGTCDGRFASASPVKCAALTAPRYLAALGIIIEGGAEPPIILFQMRNQDELRVCFS